VLRAVLAGPRSHGERQVPATDLAEPPGSNHPEEVDSIKEQSTIASAISKEVAAEISQLDYSRFVPVKNLVKGVSFVRFTYETDVPSEAVEAIFAKAIEKESCIGCRWTCRLIPVDISCKPFPDNFERAVAPLLARWFPSPAPKAKIEEASPGSLSKDGKDETIISATPAITWGCQYVSRHTNTLPREKVYEIVGNIIGKEYKVDLTDSDLTVLIEVNPVFCGASVVRNFHKFAKYNLFRVCHPEGEEQIRQQSEKDRALNEAGDQVGQREDGDQVTKGAEGGSGDEDGGGDD